MGNQLEKGSHKFLGRDTKITWREGRFGFILIFSIETTKKTFFKISGDGNKVSFWALEGLRGSNPTTVSGSRRSY